MTEARTCGGCTLCCRILSVFELEKPPYRWCPHADIGKGCKIYEDRPESCRRFTCMWLINDWMPDSLRPDRCKVVFEGTGPRGTVAALVDPGRPDAWQRPDVQTAISIMVRHGNAVVVVSKPNEVAGVVCPPDKSPDDVIAEIVRTRNEAIERLAEQTGLTVAEVEARRARM